MAEVYSGHLAYDDSQTGADRRKAERYDRKFELSYSVISLPDEKTIIETLDKFLTAQTADVSEGGVCMWTNKILTPGTTIQMQFPTPVANRTITVKARVVWCQPVTEGGAVRARMGLEFFEMASENQAKLIELIKGS